MRRISAPIAAAAVVASLAATGAALPTGGSEVLAAAPKAAAATSGEGCEMSALLPDAGRLTLEYVRPSTDNPDRNDYRLQGTFRWDHADALKCFADRGWAYEHEIVYPTWFDRKLWNETADLPSDAGFYVDTTASDASGVTTLSVGVGRPGALEAGVDYSFGYDLFLPDDPPDGVHWIRIAGEVVQRSCGFDSTWCVGLPGADRAKSGAFVGDHGGFAAHSTTCWAWTSDGAPPVDCSPPPAPVEVADAPPAPAAADVPAVDQGPPPPPPADSPPPPPPPPPAPPPPPPAAPAASIRKGAPVNRSDCYTSPCAWIEVTASGFSPNRNVNVVCSSSRETAFWTYTLTTDGSGNASGSGCYYGYPGDSVWVDVDGVRSNVITW